MNNQRKTEALQRMILKFMPKKKRGFMQIDSVAFVKNDNPFYSMPFIRCYINEYLITKNGFSTKICNKNNINQYTRNGKIDSKAINKHKTKS